MAKTVTEIEREAAAEPEVKAKRVPKPKEDNAVSIERATGKISMNITLGHVTGVQVEGEKGKRYFNDTTGRDTQKMGFGFPTPKAAGQHAGKAAKEALAALMGRTVAVTETQDDSTVEGNYVEGNSNGDNGSEVF